MFGATQQERNVGGEEDPILIVKCPVCGLEMLPKENRRSANFFWGCGNYPKCRGTRQLPPVPDYMVKLLRATECYEAKAGGDSEPESEDKAEGEIKACPHCGGRGLRKWGNQTGRGVKCLGRKKERAGYKTKRDRTKDRGRSSTGPSR